MNKTRYLKGPCNECGGNIEFPVDLIGTVVDCPHCGKSTELRLATPPQEPTVSRKLIVWTAVAGLILVLGVVGSLIALKRAQALAARRAQAAASLLAARQQEQSAAQQEQARSQNSSAAEAPAASTNASSSGPDFVVSAINLDKVPGTSLIYAKGRVTNPLDRQRFGVRVELDLLDAAGQKVGTTKDYAQVIDPKADWDFKALVVPSKAVSAKLASIKEDQ